MRKLFAIGLLLGSLLSASVSGTSFLKDQVCAALICGWTCQLAELSRTLPAPEKLGILWDPAHPSAMKVLLLEVTPEALNRFTLDLSRTRIRALPSLDERLFEENAAYYQSRGTVPAPAASASITVGHAMTAIGVLKDVATIAAVPQSMVGREILKIAVRRLGNHVVDRAVVGPVTREIQKVLDSLPFDEDPMRIVPSDVRQMYRGYSSAIVTARQLGLASSDDEPVILVVTTIPADAIQKAIESGERILEPRYQIHFRFTPLSRFEISAQALREFSAGLAQPQTLDPRKRGEALPYLNALLHGAAEEESRRRMPPPPLDNYPPPFGWGYGWWRPPY